MSPSNCTIPPHSFVIPISDIRSTHADDNETVEALIQEQAYAPIEETHPLRTLAERFRGTEDQENETKMLLEYRGPYRFLNLEERVQLREGRGKLIPNPILELEGEKLAAYHSMVEQISRITDGRGLPIDRGIQELVVALNLLGFGTTMSCEGHVDFGGALPYVMLQPYSIPNNIEQLVGEFALVNEELAKRDVPEELRVLYPDLLSTGPFTVEIFRKIDSVELRQSDLLQFYFEALWQARDPILFGPSPPFTPEYSLLHEDLLEMAVALRSLAEEFKKERQGRACLDVEIVDRYVRTAHSIKFIFTTNPSLEPDFKNPLSDSRSLELGGKASLNKEEIGLYVNSPSYRVFLMNHLWPFIEDQIAFDPAAFSASVDTLIEAQAEMRLFARFLLSVYKERGSVYQARTPGSRGDEG